MNHTRVKISLYFRQLCGDNIFTFVCYNRELCCDWEGSLTPNWDPTSKNPCFPSVCYHTFWPTTLYLIKVWYETLQCVNLRETLLTNCIYSLLNSGRAVVHTAHYVKYHMCESKDVWLKVWIYFHALAEPLDGIHAGIARH
jgi:hypothetical protein